MQPWRKVASAILLMAFILSAQMNRPLPQAVLT
jgi:hypothetical protein